MKAEPIAPVRWIYAATRMPRAWWSAGRILSRRFGHARSGRRGEPLDGEGREIPRFEYPAIEYLIQLDFPRECTFGSRGDRQPLHGMGSLPHREEEP